MLFKRRDRRNPLQYLGSFFKSWSDWKRSFIYIKHRVLRLPYSTHSISMGLAVGCVVSWTPVFGFHILQCFIFCKIFRASFLASLLGTLFGNPWTFPILLGTSYLVGNFTLSYTGLEEWFLLKTGADVMHDESLAVSAFLPTLIGGYMMAVITFPLFYFGFYSLIAGARKAKQTVGVVGEKVHDKVYDMTHRHKEDKLDKE